MIDFGLHALHARERERRRMLRLPGQHNSTVRGAEEQDFPPFGKASTERGPPILLGFFPPSAFRLSRPPPSLERGAGGAAS